MIASAAVAYPIGRTYHAGEAMIYTPKYINVRV
jgi:hypothetical protein